MRRSHVLTILLAGAAVVVAAPDPVLADAPKPTGPSATAGKTPGKIPTKKAPKPRGNGSHALETVYCRGPFAVVSRTLEVWVAGNAVTTPKGAGQRGVHLKPGECGWRRHPWNSSKANIVLRERSVGNNLPTIVGCAHDADCILEVELMAEEDDYAISSVDNVERLATYPKGFPWKDIW